MDKYIEELIKWYYENKKENENVSIEEVRKVIADKYDISLAKALSMIKKIVRTPLCNRSSDTEYLIMFNTPKGSVGVKTFRFNMGMVVAEISHVRICKRGSKEYWENVTSQSR